MEIITVTSSSTMTEIQTALKTSGATIIFQSGTYYITKTLYLYSNTRIILMPKAILRRSKTIQAIFMTYHTSSTTAYNGASNIIIEGNGQLYGVDSVGTYDNFITLFHAKDITIKDLSFLDTQGSHAIEVNSSSNVLIDNCNFYGYVTDTDGTFREAIQIDFAGYSELVTATSTTASCYDGTMCKDTTISNCRFAESSYHSAPNTAIGAHSRPNSDAKHKNIKVLNNVATGGDYVGCFMKLIAMEDVLISGNSISNYHRGILITTPLKAYETTGVSSDCSYNGESNNIIIKDNIFKDAIGSYLSTGVLSTSSNNTKHKNISVISNLFDIGTVNKKQSYAVDLQYADKCLIANNLSSSEKQMKYRAIASTTTNSICDNNN